MNFVIASRLYRFLLLSRVQLSFQSSFASFAVAYHCELPAKQGKLLNWLLELRGLEGDRSQLVSTQFVKRLRLTFAFVAR